MTHTGIVNSTKFFTGTKGASVFQNWPLLYLTLEKGKPLDRRVNIFHLSCRAHFAAVDIAPFEFGSGLHRW